MLRKIKEGILNRLFKGITIDEITVNKIKTTGEETAYLDLIKLDSRTSNPSLSEGLLWFRSDLDNVYLSPDGSNAVQMLKDGDPVELKDGNYAGALVGISGTATGRAASLDNLDATVSSRLASADYVTERGTDNAALASVCTETRLARLDAAVSTRSSHDDPDPNGYIDHSIADLITRTKGLDDIHDDVAAITPGLTFTEIADQSVAAGASVTPTVDGIFSAMMEDTDEMSMYIYSDAGAAWRMCAGLTNTGWDARGHFYIAVVGEGNKIKFMNRDTAAHNMVVNRVG